MKHSFYLLSLFLFSIAFADTGNISFVIGKVDVQKKGKSSWESVFIDKEIENGDRIRTRLQSRCEVLLPDESLLNIGENTVFEIKIVDSKKEEEYSFFLWIGKVTAKFKKLVSSKQRRTIESPSAVVAVRGTEFSMGVDQGKRTSVRVKSGKVEYTSKSTGKSVFVGVNQISTVVPGQDPTPPRESDDSEQLIEMEGESSDDEVRVKLQINLSKFTFTEQSVRTQGLKIPGTSNPGAQISAGSAIAVADASGSFQLLVAVNEGLNSVNITAKLDDQTASTKLRVFINTEKPNITLKRPVNSRFVRIGKYDLEGAIADETPMDQVELFINKRQVGKFGGKSNFRIPIILKEGLNELTITARDRSGNTKQESQTLFLDSIKPQIVVTRPATSGQIINLPPNPPSALQRPKIYIVGGRVLDPQPSSGLEKVTVNGVSIQLSPNGQFELPIRLKVGVNQIVFIARDRAGNEQRVTRAVIVRRGN